MSSSLKNIFYCFQNKDELRKLKKLEFKILMQETSKIKLLNHYKEFCEEIFYNIELEKITQN